jgi:hypothetical protein
LVLPPRPLSLPDGTSTTFRSLLSDTTAINTDDGNLTLHLDPVSALMMTNRMSSIGL